MSTNPNETRNTAIAAAIILLVVGSAIYFLPKIVMGLAGWSPVAGFIAGLVVVMAFFAIFWVRTRMKR